MCNGDGWGVGGNGFIYFDVGGGDDVIIIGN